MHYTSGVANHFFYLLAEGAVVPTGRGAGTSGEPCAERPGLQRQHRPGRHRPRGRAADLVPRADGALHLQETYADARVATLAAATDLYGTGSAQYNAVAAAWDAVNVH